MVKDVQEPVFTELERTGANGRRAFASWRSSVQSRYAPLADVQHLVTDGDDELARPYATAGLDVVVV
jgi:hypothetical protein